MDIATIVGITLGMLFLLGSIVINGFDKLVYFYDTPSVFIVFGGALGAVLVAYPLKTILKFHTVAKHAFFNKDRSPIIIITQLVSLAETARRDGLLALENRMDEIDDKFLASGVRMAVDGMSPEVVESIMSTEIEAVNNRHTYGRSLLSNYAKYAPAFGMKGTLIGLILMLSKLDPEKIGAGMAVAVITTLYGAIVANLFCLPMADKLGFLNDGEIQYMEIVLKGVLAIQAGENPRVIKQKLLTYIAPVDRPTDDEGEK